MKRNLQSLAFACGLATIMLSWGAGSARAQTTSSFSGLEVPAVRVPRDSADWPGSMEDTAIRPRARQRHLPILLMSSCRRS